MANNRIQYRVIRKKSNKRIWVNFRLAIINSYITVTKNYWIQFGSIIISYPKTSSNLATSNFCLRSFGISVYAVCVASPHYPVCTLFHLVRSHRSTFIPVSRKCTLYIMHTQFEHICLVSFFPFVFPSKIHFLHFAIKKKSLHDLSL